MRAVDVGIERKHGDVVTLSFSEKGLLAVAGDENGQDESEDDRAEA